MYLNSVLSELSGYVSSGSCEQNKLLGYKNNVDTIFGQLAIVHNEILVLCKPEEIESEVVEHMKSLKPVHQCLATIHLETQNIEQTQSSMSISNVNSLPNSITHGTSHHVQCKLPKMQMSEFNGDPLGWQGFWDRYEVSVDSNTNIRDIDKLNYLKGCLKGEALDAISV